jgi:hypothetical protein
MQLFSANPQKKCHQKHSPPKLKYFLKHFPIFSTLYTFGGGFGITPLLKRGTTKEIVPSQGAKNLLEKIVGKKRAAKTKIMETNSFASRISPAYADFNTIYVNENTAKDLSDLNSLSQEKQNEVLFLLGHEATHIKNYDVAVLQCSLILLPFIIRYGRLGLIQLVKSLLNTGNPTKQTKKQKELISFCKKIQRRIPKKLLQFFSHKATIAFLEFYCFLHVQGWISRLIEKRADITSARACRTAQGGISFFEQFPAKTPSDLLHPNPEDRIAYLKALGLD